MEFQVLQRRVQFFVVGVFVLTVVVALLMMRPVSVKSSAPNLSVMEPVELQHREGAADLAPILNQPLFWAERAPYVAAEEEAEVVEVAPKSNALDDAQLVGVITTSEGSVVMLKLRDKVLRMALLDELDGWVLVDIEPEQAVFSLGIEGEGEPEFTIIELQRREPLPSVWQSEPQVLSEKQ